jgi:hypothetical protein
MATTATTATMTMTTMMMMMMMITMIHGGVRVCVRMRESSSRRR